ncbi:bifunctional DNA primase/polymerase [Mycobacterium kansasii]|uniref:bifunctional DNA primase/polymerase n=1 Tax=Mycobacterium kansasii TaxID=1768 RepID=UPI003A8574CF
MNAPLDIPELPDGVSALGAALAYAAAGWYVLPVKRGTKHPGSRVKERWQEKSSREPEQIVAWFAGTDDGIALHCGRSGAVVLDVDKPDLVPAQWWPALDSAPYQSSRPDTPRRGHYLFLMPPDRTIGNPEFPGGEVRGLNGVIIAAPTVHSKGGAYRWVRSMTLPALPDIISDGMADGGAGEDAATDRQVAEFLAAHTAANRPEVINGLRKALADKIEAGKSVHVSTNTALVGAMKEAAAGYYTAASAIEVLKPLFLNAVALGGSTGKVRKGRQAESEWHGMLSWGIGQALAADPKETRARVAEKMPDNVERVERIDGADKPNDVAPLTLSQAHDVFTRWLGNDYDLDALDAMLAAAAVERFADGSDPVWLLLISGPGNAKTETVQALDGIGAIVTSAVSSEAALLSATPKRERAKSATGGLLRKLGSRGVLVIKDVTSILSMNRDLRARVLAALREIYDGRWYREVGTDGGQTIPWEGRIVVIGAVTTAWDSAHAVVSSMGDRFVLVRIDSTTGRQPAGRKAIRNTGEEPKMRAELAAAVAGVFAGMSTEPTTITDKETDALLAAADLVTLARTGVEYDYRGDVIDAHAPEMPTRFAKQLAQIVRGAVAVGMGRDKAMRLAIRCARDSMPPLRLAIIEDLAERPHSSTGEIRKRLDKPHNTVDRQLQALHILGVVTVEERRENKNAAPRWFYSLAPGVDPDAVFPEMSVHTPSPLEERIEEQDAPGIGTDKSGNAPRRAGCICANQPQPCQWCRQVAS